MFYVHKLSDKLQEDTLISFLVTGDKSTTLHPSVWTIKRKKIFLQKIQTVDKLKLSICQEESNPCGMKVDMMFSHTASVWLIPLL